MKYGSVCSGIEAATCAWHPLGWSAQWYSEIEKFPSAVLDHHYPQTPNLGDMMEIKDDQLERIAGGLLVGGTPCQSFSVAGLRRGLADPRGNLALGFLRLADVARPKWVVWENVPGVLSSHQGRDFGAFLGALGKLGYGWSYRVLDAQYVRVESHGRAVPQRRRRVFVVGYLGDWRPAAAVLFERQSLSRHPAPRREAGQRVAALTANGVGTCGADDNQGQAGHLIPEISPAIKARDHKGPSSDGDGDGDGDGAPLIPVAFHGAQDPDVSGDVTHPLGLNHGQECCIAYQCHGNNVGPMGTLRGGNGNETGGVPFVPVSFNMHKGASEASTLGVAENRVDCLRAFEKSPFAVQTTPTAVRRLTPLECERLQGFPDGYTNIPYGRPQNADQICPDGPRYKALGNSMAVNVMSWIGRRIEAVENVLKSGGVS